MRSDIQPFVQSATLVRFKVTEPDPTKFRRINDGSYAFERERKHVFEAGMHQKRFVIFDQKLVELNSVVRVKRGDSIKIRSDFSHIAFHCISPLRKIRLPREKQAGYSFRSDDPTPRHAEKGLKQDQTGGNSFDRRRCPISQNS